MPDTLEREIRIAARPETVFRYLTESAAMAQWMGDAAELEPTAGGQFLVRYDHGDTALGQFTVVEPHTRVAFTWGWKDSDGVPPGSTSVEITLVDDDGDTVLNLRHSGLPDAEARTKHGEGWDHFLAQLTTLLASR